jgi:hypothetical protein
LVLSCAIFAKIINSDTSEHEGTSGVGGEVQIDPDSERVIEALLLDRKILSKMYE